jgi:hypothetical protein
MSIAIHLHCDGRKMVMASELFPALGYTFPLPLRHDYGLFHDDVARLMMREVVQSGMPMSQGMADLLAALRTTL